jgi:hypothetical protein
VALAGLLGTPSSVLAQALKDVQNPDTPLVLKAQGSFFVGGEKVTQTQGELGNLGPGRHHHREPDVRPLHGAAGRRRERAGGHVHGATLTGKSWETTPDGRMGWDEYFVRKGPVELGLRGGRHGAAGRRPSRRDVVPYWSQRRSGW